MNTQNINLFIKEVSKYFMDFLETDFHKRKTPKRNIQYRNSSNLLVGISLTKYESFKKIIWKAIHHRFQGDLVKNVSKGVYRTTIPENLKDLIERQIDQINKKLIDQIIELSAEQIEQLAVLHSKSYDEALSNSLDQITKIYQKNLIFPLISNLEKPLNNLKLGDENDFFMLGEELTLVLISSTENKVSEILKLLISKEKVNSIKELKKVIDTDAIKTEIRYFFENYKVGDLFAELYEMERNKAILDKQEFYLYFCDISFNGAKYPIFYIPIALDKKSDIISINFDSQVYINKKALEYITQEINQEQGKVGSLATIGERILYLSNYDNNFVTILQTIIDDIVNFFDLNEKISILTADEQLSRNSKIKVTNGVYISLFDKSDEALVNDYEEIIEVLENPEGELSASFHKLIDDFINNNPDPVNPDVEDEWENSGISEKLIFTSPVPLNSEQLQILSALNKSKCKYTTVEGPPGTGKSHTITAIIFDHILKDKSVLVLSDKKEALDVVEDKISETLNNVRTDKNFQNPLLRLGKTGNTYSQILSTSSLENIKSYYKAIKKNQEVLEENISKIKNTVREDIEAELFANKEVSLSEVKELIDLDSYFVSKKGIIDKEEALLSDDYAHDIEKYRTTVNTLARTVELLSKHANGKQFKFENNNSIYEVKIAIEQFTKLHEKYKELLKIIENDDLKLISLFKTYSIKSYEKLNTYLLHYHELKKWVFGFALNKEEVSVLDRKFRTDFLFDSSFEAHKKLSLLKQIQIVSESILSYQSSQFPTELGDFDFISAVHFFLNDDLNNEFIDSIYQLKDLLLHLENITSFYPHTFNNIDINKANINELTTHPLITIDDLEFQKILRFAYLSYKLAKDFSEIPSSNYTHQMKQLQDLVTAKMTYLLDGRLINFYENNKSTAATLKQIIRTKKKFPREEFIKLKEAFPCILAGIRDYAEFIPLEPEMFDLLIIDEASQVSIAQSFPALLRAKKVLILGDNKQFSNVKSAQARSDTNREYLNSVKSAFTKYISTDDSKLVKLDKFNIKTSILDFFEFISNYRSRLRKHFRGYKELISYSNKYFYQNDLQVMKIRGKGINDVIKFNFVEHDGKEELIRNTNTPEIDFIISELIRLKDEKSNQTVGIITPHTNQQKSIIEAVSKIPDKDYFFDNNKLKIMTFDTCQGEERDIIYYSMVATKEIDHLWGVFISSLSSIDIEEEGKIKAQRLNVGFSRAKESMVFVLSKPLEDFSGSIGEALRHYQYALEEAKLEKTPVDTDVKSKMEPEVLNWFYQTNFYKENKENIDFQPQFELGKYLKQLDKMYTHPAYKVDFLLTYKDQIKKEHKIIIEYDGFTEHFKDAEGITSYNYESYYSEEDLYRQRVLQSYGYKFLRINKFNIGNDPITTLNNRIEELLTTPQVPNGVIDIIHSTVNNLNNGTIKECPKCKNVQDIEEFKDRELISGYGRFCKTCKQKKANETLLADNPTPVLSEEICPKCNSRMILRNGKYGKFYGCSRFPYCRGTREY